MINFNLQINAMANRAAGKGYENENFYDNIKFKFFGIENIHVMRASLSKLIDCKFHIEALLHTKNNILPKRLPLNKNRHFFKLVGPKTIILNQVV